ncbi:acetyl-CoA acetyltransferase [Pseudarthrobacter sulfonivorans]|uniref:Acetyl-CoA acetyltransferase n=1 Tax=Pseudarthrobacter sulfonivorans TaxID=121292 RepID=A0A0U3P3I7_9MICC|nr:thiolase family protein [Pseudarthrobacter sulfonivorans]ALV39904.1 acetyl-CoA acetyltransferase [Pseudarthrobacter sulfonivorans]
MSTRDAVVVLAKRSAVGLGRPEKGVFSGMHSVDLSAQVLRAVVDESGIDPVLIDDVHWGCVSQVGEQSFNVGRNAVLAAGLPESVPGTTVDRQCGSSQQTIHNAAAQIMAGHADIVIAGGVEVMSRTPMFSNTQGGAGPFGPMMKQRYPKLVNQGISAEMIAEKWGLSRTYLDEMAVESHRRAAEATAKGLFEREIVPIETASGTVTTDQGIRPGSTVEKLAGLPNPFKEGGVVTAGNASQLSDGSAALMLMSSEKARELGLKPIARVHSVSVIGDDPIMMLTAPIPATAKVLKRAGLSIEDIGVIEINEAFASVVGAWLSETGADPQKVNPRGGAMALGHPLGGSGARLATTLLHIMQDTGAQYGLQTMCEGGGMANATIFELL